MSESQLESSVPALVESCFTPAYAPGPIPLGSPAGWEPFTVPLSHYLWILKRHRWKILAFVGSVVAATAVISSRLTPIYESTATVDIDRQMPAGVIGQEATRAPLNDADQFLATQIKLIQSDSVLRPVAERYHLREAETGRMERLAGTRGADAPVVLKRLKVTRPPNTYLLLISYRSSDPQLAADAANAIAQSYLEHAYKIRYRSAAGLSAFMEKQLEELKAKMERSSAALAAFERELNVISPEEKTSILSARLLQLNTDYTQAQGERMRKQAIYQSVEEGSLEAAQVSAQGEALRQLMERRNQAREQFAELKAHYGANHPAYRKAAAQLQELEQQLREAWNNICRRVEVDYRQALRREQMLEQAVAQTKAEFDRLNARSFQYQSLKREAEADKQLYEELVRKIKEAGINASFPNSSIRIADPARPALKPVFPNLKLNLLLAFMLSTLAAVGGAVLSDVLDNTLRDPEQVRRTLGAEVVGSLPVVKPWRGRLGPVVDSPTPAASTPPDTALTGYEESIRTLRNSILLADFDRRLRSVLVTSASPGEGKSTIAAHLAVAHASQGHKTLLIDGDLRRPSVHRRFKTPGVPGLANVLLAELPWQQALVRLQELPELDLLPAGPPSRRAADLVGKGLAQLLEEAALHYDLVILDAPPLLGFAEPLHMASVTDGVLVVTRAGQTSRKAVAGVLATLRRLRAPLLGLVLNQVHKEMSDSYYYYGYYGKYYKQPPKS